MEQKHQQQQQTVLLQPQVVQSASFVYADLPLAKLKRLGIAQIVIGSICIIFYMLTFLLGQHWLYSFWDFLFGCMVLACGITAMMILTRRNRTMVQATAITSVIAAVLSAITVLICIIALIGLFIVDVFAAMVAQEMHNQHRNSSNTTGIANGTYHANSTFDYHHTDTDDRLGLLDAQMQSAYITTGMTLVFFIAELVVASLLANVTLRIMRNAQLVPANPPPVVTTVVYAQA